MVGIIAIVAASVLAYFVAGSVPIEEISGLPVPIPMIFALMTGVAFVLAVLVLDRLWELWRTQRERLSGAKMHRRLALLLSVVALFPAAVAFTLTGAMMGTLADEFFVERIETSSSVARNLANAYADSVSREMGFNILIAERELSRAMSGGVRPDTAPIGYRKYLSGLATLYRFGELTHIGPEGKVIVRTTVSNMPPQPLPPQSFLTADSGVENVARVSFGAVDQDTLNVWFIVIPIRGGADGYLVGYRAENPVIAHELVAVREFRDANRALQTRVMQLSSVANGGFLLLSVVLLLGAALVGLIVANAIVNPIRRLATAADRVSAGDLTGRVEVKRRDGELGDLGKAFNDMTERLAQQREELIAANEDAENRRLFIETMLAVIPAGVISVNSDGEIGVANPAASRILGQDPQELLGKRIDDVIPPIARLFDMTKKTGRRSRESLEWGEGGSVRSLIVEISPETDPGEDSPGYVITIEDITELVTAQRTAAWADVARRIAHEIKNPLTPIQLSAERLRRRYAKDLEGRDREIFDQCTATIVKHVGDIGRMVTEFSSFARMPEPIMAKNDLRELAREAVFPFTVANPNVTYDVQLPDHPVEVLCDGRLIVQALTNLIKNATEAITEDETVEDGRVEVEVIEERSGVRVEVRDNGRGLPDKLRHRLTEPYMTTREKGTGLGLAIVRKAIEDHDGSFEIRDREGGGAVASLFLPRLQSAVDPGQETVTDEQHKPEEPALHGH
ncbi:sensor histidine kinase [Parvularcula lutaonensis]|uniref:histidine kinase n=1 Tax=Parvularcula lutaonensis TaxID=491923 RepID=A0ABV7MEG2_9PROT|nr:ATP-binding protein [Parvularcula lutaonensis]GGY52644.1 PAS domain-containing sensor histidine kinase [Parvularcula lutaonensis]